MGAGCVGFCRILATRRRLTANAHFKAHFGWPPDALLERGDLEARVHAQDRAALADAITAALAEGTPLDLTVRAVWPCGTSQYIALQRTLRACGPRGRCGSQALGQPAQLRIVNDLLDLAEWASGNSRSIRVR